MLRMGLPDGEALLTLCSDKRPSHLAQDHIRVVQHPVVLAGRGRLFAWRGLTGSAGSLPNIVGQRCRTCNRLRHPNHTITHLEKGWNWSTHPLAGRG